MYTKRQLNGPNDNKMCLHLPLQYLPKYTQIGIFGLKISILSGNRAANHYIIIALVKGCCQSTVGNMSGQQVGPGCSADLAAPGCSGGLKSAGQSVFLDDALKQFFSLSLSLQNLIAMCLISLSSRRIIFHKNTTNLRFRDGGKKLDMVKIFKRMPILRKMVG
jgi:hypothetical protein